MKYSKPRAWQPVQMGAVGHCPQYRWDEFIKCMVTI